MLYPSVVLMCDKELTSSMTEQSSEFDAWASDAEPLLRRAFAGTLGPDRAGDAVAEALAFAWEHWDRVCGMDNSVGYVYRVGRSRTRDRGTPSLPAPSQVGLPDIEPGLVPALLQLPENQRVAVWLVHACGWRHSEVGDAMGVSPSTVSTHVARAIESLRRDLEVTTDA